MYLLKTQLGYFFISFLQIDSLSSVAIGKHFCVSKMQQDRNPLINVEWLVENLHVSTNLKIVDATWVYLSPGDGYKKFYQKQHIPGAQFFDLDHCCEPTEQFPCPLPSSERFIDYIERLGISNDSHVIIYDQTDAMGTFKTWWLFKYFGHDNVSVLDGGLQQWLNAGQSVTDKVCPVQKSVFKVHRRSPMEKLFEDIVDIVQKNSEEIVDVRPAEFFDGNHKNGGGHIANSKNVPYLTLFNEDGCMKSKNELEKLLQSASIDLNKPIVSTCQVGVSACGMIAALELLGKDSTLYVGSWHEWSARNGSNASEF